MTSSRSSLSSHEPPPTPPSSCHSSSLHFDGPPTPSFPRRRHPSDSSLDSEGAHVVHVGAAGMGVGGHRGWERDVVLRELSGGRREMVRESVRMSQCVVWECLPFPTRKRNHYQGQAAFIYPALPFLSTWTHSRLPLHSISPFSQTLLVTHSLLASLHMNTPYYYKTVFLLDTLVILSSILVYTPTSRG